MDMSGDFSEGDILMICSDGISDVLNDQDIRDIVIEHKQDEELKDCCIKIYEKAIEKGSSVFWKTSACPRIADATISFARLG